MSKLIDSDKATTQQELETIIDTAFRMTGEPAPQNRVAHDAFNGEQGGTYEGEGSNKAAPEAVNSLASAMGLDITPPKAV